MMVSTLSAPPNLGRVGKEGKFISADVGMRAVSIGSESSVSDMTETIRLLYYVF